MQTVAFACGAIAVTALAACGSSSSPPPLDFGPTDAGVDGHADAHSSPSKSDATLLHLADGAPPTQPASCSGGEGGTASGCEYYVVFPGQEDVEGRLCAAIFVVNASSAPVSMTLDKGGVPFDLSASTVLPSGSGPSLTYTPLTDSIVPPASVAIIIAAVVDYGPGDGGVTASCPATPLTTLPGGPMSQGSSVGYAFHLKTSAPTTAYDMFPYGGAVSAVTSASLLLATSVWSTSYVGVMPGAGGNYLYDPELKIVALANDTHVSVLPTAAVAGASAIVDGGPGVEGGAAQQTEEYTLQAGQVLSLAADTGFGDLTGTIVTANNPVGVWGTAACMDLPDENTACDSAHQQIPPVSALGHDYVAVRYRSRVDGDDETVPWRLVGAVDGTTLAYSPAAPAGAPTNLSAGQVVSFFDPGPFSVSSQDSAHPFYMGAHMTSATFVSGSDIGDPEWVNVIPVAEYLTSYSFFTDPTYPETNLVVVRSAGADEVRLDCAGLLTGWQPVDSTGLYEFTRIDLSRHDFVGQNDCDNGFHTMSSTAPFGLTVWGWGTSETTVQSTYVSYAYPAGAGVQPINSVVVSAAPPK